MNSTACRGRLCCRNGRLCSQCVRGQSDTVDFVDFQQSQPCCIQLCRQCVPGLTLRLTVLETFAFLEGQNFGDFVLGTDMYHHAKFHAVAEISVTEQIERITADLNLLSDNSHTSVAFVDNNLSTFYVYIFNGLCTFTNLKFYAPLRISNCVALAS